MIAHQAIRPNAEIQQNGPKAILLHLVLWKLSMRVDFIE